MGIRRPVFVLVIVGAACHGTGVRELRGAGDERVYEAKCKSAAECIANTRATCASGYELLDSESHAGGLLADALPGPVTWYSMTFKCDVTGSSERPDFPFRGATYNAPSAAPERGASNEGEPSSPHTVTAPTVAPFPRSRPVETSAGGSAGCSSDFECGFGNLCVKGQNSFKGTCAKAVNEFGNPTFTPPRTNSVGPGGEGQCAFDTECPIGFRCVKGSALRGNCMK